MIPKRVALENFLSFGSPKTEIAFTDDEPLWVLGGPNGVGKSAVFDAMTFALFGEHRGGKQDADLLVRHGENGFSVTFEFEFDGTNYRITRNRMSKHSTASVERKHPDTGDWKRVENVNSIAGVKGWSERTLGLEFNAFCASVLLRQGKADEIITATGKRRLEILKKIIAAERYEALSVRVHDEVRKLKGKFDDLKTRRDGMRPVEQADLDAAQAAVAGAEQAKSTAQEHVNQAVMRVGQARQWADLTPRRAQLDGLIRAANERSANGDRIRRDKARLDDLRTAVPTLKSFIMARSRIAMAEESLGHERSKAAALQTEVDRLSESINEARDAEEKHRNASEEHVRAVGRLKEELTRDEKFLEAADEIARLRAQLNDIPNDLDEQLAAARLRVQEATARALTAGNAKAEIAGLLKQAKMLQKGFSTVGVGVICSLCRQVVTEEHAEAERLRLAQSVHELESNLRDAENEKTRADLDKQSAESACEQFVDRVNSRNAIAKQHADQNKTFSSLGVSTDPARLREQLTQKRSDIERLGTLEQEEAAKRDAAGTTARKAEATRNEKAAELRKAEQRLATQQQNLAGDQSARNTLRDQLTPDWQSRCDTIGSAEVDSLETERARLSGSDVLEQFNKLAQDIALRDEWTNQRDGLDRQIQEIPELARVTVSEAEASERTAKKAAHDADAAWATARDAAGELTRRAAAYRTVVGEIATIEWQYDLHRKLDDLLGKDGLQRELVRGAEAEIVRLANDTVRNLSSGDLTLELERNDDSDDEAFALRVRQADKPAPTGVDYLSGSQKFRVAVAVALAIGQFAAGQARRLDCVIIDEGFGSLDKDGLRAARDELNRLSQFLRRIILVSHQEDFANEFPVVIQLSHGPNGTTATALRR